MAKSGKAIPREAGRRGRAWDGLGAEAQTPQDRHLVPKGDELQFQRGSATKTEAEQGAEGGQKREHADDGMTAATETLHLLGFWSFEQGQP